jgi:hypothetical protein
MHQQEVHITVLIIGKTKPKTISKYCLKTGFLCGSDLVRVSVICRGSRIQTRFSAPSRSYCLSLGHGLCWDAYPHAGPLPAVYKLLCLCTLPARYYLLGFSSIPDKKNSDHQAVGLDRLVRSRGWRPPPHAAQNMEISTDGLQRGDLFSSNPYNLMQKPLKCSY